MSSRPSLYWQRHCAPEFDSINKKTVVEYPIDEIVEYLKQSNWAVAETAAYKAKEATKLSTLTWCIADPGPRSALTETGLYLTEGGLLTHAKSMAALARRTVATVQGKFESKPMTYTADHKNLASYVGHGPPRRNAVVNGCTLRRVFGALLKAMHGSRRRQTERDIANYVASRGGRITDDLEREITRRLLPGLEPSRKITGLAAEKLEPPVRPHHCTLSQSLPPRGTTFAARGRLSSTLT